MKLSTPLPRSFKGNCLLIVKSEVIVVFYIFAIPSSPFQGTYAHHNTNQAEL